MTPEDSPQEPDLITRLRSAEGPAERTRLLAALDELESRIKARLRTGLTRDDYEMLFSAHLAVQACRDTLNRLNLTGPEATQSPLRDGSFFNRSRS